MLPDYLPVLLQMLVALLPSAAPARYCSRGGMTFQNLFFNIELNNSNVVGLNLASEGPFFRHLVPFSGAKLDRSSQAAPVLTRALIGDGASILIGSAALVVPEPGSDAVVVLVAP